MYKIKLILFFMLSIFLMADKVEISSDSMKAEELKKEIHFMGNVKIKQLKSWIEGDKVIVYFDDNNQTSRYEAIGAVSFEFKKDNRFYKGKANRVVYAPLESKYILTGNAQIDDMVNKRHINGENITLDLNSGFADVVGKKEEPVKFIFETSETK